MSIHFGEQGTTEDKTWPNDNGRLSQLWQAINSLPDPPGLSIQDANHRIVKANSTYIQRWGNITGQICYEARHKSAKICPWCPVKNTWENGKVSVGHVASPDRNNCQSRMLHSIILAIPDEHPKGSDPDHILEIVFDVSDEIAIETRTRQDRYTCFSQFANILEKLPENDINNMILLAAVANDGIGCAKASLLIANTSNDDKPGSMKEVQSLESFEMPMLKGIGTRSQYDINSDIAKVLMRKSSSPAHGKMIAFIAGMLSTNKLEVRKWMKESYPRRWGDGKVATCILGSNGALFLVLRVEVDERKRLVSDEMLADLDFFAQCIRQAIERRITRIVRNNLQKIYNHLQEDEPGFIANSMMLLGGSHELKRYIRRFNESKASIELFKNLPDDINPHLQTLITYANEISIHADLITNLAGLVKPKLQHESLHTLIEDICARWEPRLLTKRIYIEKRLKSTSPSVLADKRLIFIAFSNLLSNSELWLPGAERHRWQISISTDDEPDNVLVTYEDNGCGIAPEFLQNIWAPFETGLGSDGLGLGLPITKRIIEDLHKGSISVRSVFGNGVKFSIRIPKCKISKEVQKVEYSK